MAFVNLVGVWFTVGVERMGTVPKAGSSTLVQAAHVQHIFAPPLLGERCAAMGARTTASTRTRNIRPRGGTGGRLMHTTLLEVLAMKPIRYVLSAWLAIIIALGSSACQGSVSLPSPSVTEEPTVTPPLAGTISPIPFPHGTPFTFASIHTVPPQACLLADLPIIGGTLWHLHRFAWSPTGDRLAYVGPAEPADSLTGPLMLVAAPRLGVFENRRGAPINAGYTFLFIEKPSHA